MNRHLVFIMLNTCRYHLHCFVFFCDFGLFQAASTKSIYIMNTLIIWHRVDKALHSWKKAVLQWNKGLQLSRNKCFALKAGPVYFRQTSASSYHNELNHWWMLLFANHRNPEKKQKSNECRNGLKLMPDQMIPVILCGRLLPCRKWTQIQIHIC